MITLVFVLCILFPICFCWWLVFCFTNIRYYLLILCCWWWHKCASIWWICVGFAVGLLMPLLFGALVSIIRTLWSFGVGVRCPLVLFIFFNLFFFNMGILCLFGRFWTSFGLVTSLYIGKICMIEHLVMVYFPIFIITSSIVYGVLSNFQNNLISHMRYCAYLVHLNTNSWY